ncbi:PAS domain S-box protein [Thiorhodococcus minor]|uniref:histidine kinase n=1 Tax=Thiorhodococcus minor TaxID=57489 RepID=A0A6M0JTI8_9GAMM|nr:PAS domain S-box protein [Thiorhodococcus minor]NEV60798.1 PAS domain S-box protein [Thiorhodococcus minor]
MKPNEQLAAALMPLRGGRLLVPLLAVLLLVPLSFFSLPLFHLLAELIPIVIATSAFTIAWNTHPFSRDNFLLFLATGLFCLGLLELVHALVYKGMYLYPGAGGANLPTQFRLGARYLQALLFLVAPLTLGLPIRRLPLLLAMSTCGLLVFLWILSGRFPDAFVEGQGLTPFKIYSEYVIVALLGLALLHLHVRRAELRPDVAGPIQVAIALTMMSELAFTSSLSVYDHSEVIGLLLKVLAFWLMYGALVESAIRTNAESEERFRSAFDQQFQFMAILTPEGRVIDINDLVLRVQGCAREDYVGRYFWDSPAWRDLPEWRRIWPQRLAEAAETEGTLRTQDVYQMRDGQVRMADATTTAIRDAKGAVRWYVIQATDTTERRHAEAALRESEERLRLFIDHAPAALAMFDREMRYVAVSHRWREDFGLGDQDLIGRSHYEIFPEIPKRWREAHRRGLAGETLRAEEDWFERVDGRMQWQRWEVRPWYAADGEVGGIVTFAEEITARKEAEIALRESQRRFQDIVDASADWVWEVDAHGRYTYVSEGVHDVLGYTPEEVLGRTPFDLMPPKEAERVAARFGTIIALRKPFRDLENINRHKDGRLIHIHTTGMPMFGFDGQLLGYRGLDRDVTEKRLAEIALQESREQLRTLVSSIPDLVWMKDLQGAYLTCNARFEAFFGATESEIVGKTDDDFVDRDQADLFRANDLAAIAAGGPHVDEREITFKRDGHKELVEIIKTPVYDAAGTVIGVLGIGRDMTRARQAETELERYRHHLEEVVAERTAALRKARAEAERLAQAKGEFLANTSHEIRTPMNAVLGLAYLLERQPLPAQAQDLARKITRSSRSLLGIINDVLDFSKIESGRLDIERVPFRLGEVLDNLATIMRTSAAGKSLDLAIRPPEGLEAVLLGDPLRLSQILINLTSNAIKFTPAGMVEVRVDQTRQTSSQVQLRFTVRDTGVGIDPRTQARLFEPFTQADASTTRRYGGSGLGLVISRRLAELMGGRLGLESSPGKGSTFWVELTFDLAKPMTAELLQAPKMSVLIADDNLVAREAAVATVEALGWSAWPVASGDEALHTVLREDALQGGNAVVLLDWQMAELDGLETARLIRDALPVSSVPLIFLFTAHPLEEVEKLGSVAALDGILAKPLAPSPLYDAVVAACRGRLEEPAADRSAADARHLSGIRLLVVDDSEINREVAELIFAGEGAEVHLAKDGREAVDWLVSHPHGADVVLMDVHMPVMDGHAAARLIRELPGIARIPIVALTADAVGEQEEIALASGMDAFLAKPFDVPEAVASIQGLAAPQGGARGDGPEDAGKETETETANEGPRPEAVSEAALARASAFETTAGAAASSSAVGRPAEGKLPGLAIEQGLAIWRDFDAYRRSLRRFVELNGDVGRAIAAAEPAAAQQLAHKLKGTAGNLGLDEVSSRAADLDRALRSGAREHSEVERLVAALQAALATAFDSVARFAPAVDTSLSASAQAAPRPVSTAQTAEQAAPLLRRALLAFEAFDPVAAIAPLEDLTSYLSAEEVASALQAAEDFDSSAGAAAVHALAAELQVELQD